MYRVFINKSIVSRSITTQVCGFTGIQRCWYGSNASSSSSDTTTTTTVNKKKYRKNHDTGYYDTTQIDPSKTEEPESTYDSFDWLNKRSEKKVSSLSDVLKSKQQINTTIPSSNTNSSTTLDGTSNKDQELIDEINKSLKEIQENRPIDRANITFTTLIRVCGKLNNDKDTREFLIKKLIQLNKPITLEECHLVMQDYVSRNKESIVEQLFQMIIIDRSIIYNINKQLGYTEESLNWKDITDPKKHIETFNLLLSSYSSNGSIDKCNALLSDMVEKGVIPNDQSYLTIIECLAGSNKPLEAIDKLYEYLEASKITQEAIKTKAFNLIIHSLSRLKSLPNNIEILPTLGQLLEKGKNYFGMDCLTHQYLIECLLNNNQVDRAIDYIHQLDHDNQTTTTQSFHKLFEQLAKLNRSQEIDHIFHKVMCRANKPMVESLPDVDDFYCQKTTLEPSYHWKPNINTFNIIMECYSRCLEIDRSFQLLDYIKSLNMEPSSVIYSSLESICFRMDQMERYDKVCGEEFHIIKKKED